MDTVTLVTESVRGQTGERAAHWRQERPGHSQSERKEGKGGKGRENNKLVRAQTSLKLAIAQGPPRAH